MSTLVDQARRHADEMVRYCPECGAIGPVPEGYHACCPDSFGMSIRRWQAEKMERKLKALRSKISPSSMQPEKEERRPLSDEQIDGVYRDVWSTVAHAKRLIAFARAIEAAHGISPSPSMVGREGE